MLKKIINNLKYITLKDILSFFVLVFVCPFAFFFRIYNKFRKRKIFLICELPDSARDNGYHLFKYIRQEHPEEKFYYAINKKCNDYKKIKAFDEYIIEYGSFKHWVYYLAADVNISTQKAGNPNPPIFYFLQVFGFLRNKRVFLQHGITINDSKWMYYNETKFRLLICGAKKEYEYIKEKFGYPVENLVYTGFARFDNLIDKENGKSILLMPTWRNWLGREVNFLSKKEDFKQSTYYQKYMSLINNKILINALEEKGITLFFYPHINMQKYLSEFKVNNNSVKVISKDDFDIQELFQISSLMITDYSSVSMDFAYMGKPEIYYQFDKDEYREKQLQKGYFDYEQDGFGDVVEEEEELVNKIIYYINNNFENEDKYRTRSNEFFEIKDKKNCERNYKAIINIA